MPFNYDATGIDIDADLNLVPEGWYPFRIFAAEEMSSSTGHPMVLVKCAIFNDSRFPQVSVWHYVTFIPKDKPGAGMNIHFRKSIGVPYEGNVDVIPANWVGKRFMGKIEHQTYKGKTKNSISQISPYKEESHTQPSKIEEEIPF